jgi:hypothetical protein
MPSSISALKTGESAILALRIFGGICCCAVSIATATDSFLFGDDAAGAAAAAAAAIRAAFLAARISFSKSRGGSTLGGSPIAYPRQGVLEDISTYCFYI